MKCGMCRQEGGFTTIEESDAHIKMDCSLCNQGSAIPIERWVELDPECTRCGAGLVKAHGQELVRCPECSYLYLGFRDYMWHREYEGPIIKERWHRPIKSEKCPCGSELSVVNVAGDAWAIACDSCTSRTMCSSLFDIAHAIHWAFGEWDPGELVWSQERKGWSQCHACGTEDKLTIIELNGSAAVKCTACEYACHTFEDWVDPDPKDLRWVIKPEDMPSPIQGLLNPKYDSDNKRWADPRVGLAEPYPSPDVPVGMEASVAKLNEVVREKFQPNDCALCGFSDMEVLSSGQVECQKCGRIVSISNNALEKCHGVSVDRKYCRDCKKFTQVKTVTIGIRPDDSKEWNLCQYGNHLFSEFTLRTCRACNHQSARIVEHKDGALVKCECGFSETPERWDRITITEEAPSTTKCECGKPHRRKELDISGTREFVGVLHCKDCNKSILQGNGIRSVEDAVKFDESEDLVDGILIGNFYGNSTDDVDPDADTDVEPKEGWTGSSNYAFPIDPDTYAARNQLKFRPGNVVKYVTRHDLQPRGEGKRSLIKALDYILRILNDDYSAPVEAHYDIERGCGVISEMKPKPSD